MKRFIYFMLLAACLLSTAGCNKKKEVTVIRINDYDILLACVQRVIREKNLLEPYLPEGVTVEWTHVTGDSNIRDALSSGRIDIATLGIAGFITSIENDFPLTLISSGPGTIVYLYSHNKNIKGFEDINTSTKIATVSKGSFGTIAFAMLCEELYGDPLIFDSNLLEMHYNEMFASVNSSNDLDCIFLVLPYYETADGMDNLEKIMDFTPLLMENGLNIIFTANSDFYNNNPNLIEAFRKAQNDAVKYINEQTTEASILLGEVYNSDPVLVEKELKHWPVSLEMQGYDKLAAFMHKSGLLTKPPKKFADFPNYNDIPKR